MKLSIYRPKFEELWFKQLMLSDKATMSYNHSYGGTISFPKEKWQQWYQRWILNEEGNRFYRYLKDESDTFVGDVAYHFDEDKNIYLVDVLIYAKYRGKGYGSEALEMLCSICKERKIVEVYDEIALDNPSLHLFLLHGFSEVYRTGNTVMLKRSL